MQAGVGLLVADVMPIYMIMPRYSHNYALFYQLLDNNLFTHHNTYAILREATSETYGPRVYFPSYIYLAIYFSFAFLFRSIKPKIQKYFFALYFIWDLLFQSITTFSRQHAISCAVTRKGLTTPLTRRVATCCCLCAGDV